MMELLSMALILKLATAAAALYGLAVFGTAQLQSRLMYFPEQQRITPASAGLADVEERVLGRPGGETVLVWWGRPKPGQPTILYFHGNAGSFGSRAERIRKYMTQGYGVFMMTYRGYGGSTGKPTEAANVADAKLAYDTLVGLGVDPSDVILYGESLGSGVAVQVAAVKPAGGVILDAPYTSLVDLAEMHYPILPSRLLMTDRYESTRYIGDIRAPLLIVHGEEDSIIPVAMGRDLFAAAKAPKEIVTLPGAGHSDHYLYGSYEAIYLWIGAVRGERQAVMEQETGSPGVSSRAMPSRLAR